MIIIMNNDGSGGIENDNDNNKTCDNNDNGDSSTRNKFNNNIPIQISEADPDKSLQIPTYMLSSNNFSYKKPNCDKATQYDITHINIFPTINEEHNIPRSHSCSNTTPTPVTISPSRNSNTINNPTTQVPNNKPIPKSNSTHTLFPFKSNPLIAKFMKDNNNNNIRIANTDHSHPLKHLNIPLYNDTVSSQNKTKSIQINKTANSPSSYSELIKSNRELLTLSSNNKHSSIPENNYNNNDIYHKQMLQRARLNLKLEKLRKQKLQHELNELKSKPSINHKSKMLTKDNIPIYMRVEQITQASHEKRMKIQNEIEQEEDVDCSFCCGRNYKHERNFDDLIKRNEKFIQDKQYKIQMLKEELDELYSETQDLQFKPKINHKSRSMVKDNYKNVSERIGKDRDKKEKFIKRKIEESTPSFTPSINKDFKIGKRYYDYMYVDQAEKFINNYKRGKKKQQYN